jgi:hypothetical protein
MVECETSAAPRVVEYISSGSSIDRMFKEILFVSSRRSSTRFELARFCCISAGRGNVAASEMKVQQVRVYIKNICNILDDFSSSSVIARTDKLPGCGRSLKSGFVLTMK